jgi:hypothetical protein
MDGPPVHKPRTAINVHGGLCVKRFLQAILSTLPVVALSLAGSAHPAAAAAKPYEIRHLSGTFSPAPLSPAAVQSLAQQGAALAAAGQETVHVLVQLHEVPSVEQKNELWRDGLDLGSYATGSAFIAAVPAARLGEIAARPEVRWLALWDADRKLHPRIRQNDFGSWTVDPSRPEFVMLMVQLHHDVPLDNLYKIADQLGAGAQGPIVGIHGMTVWVPRDKVAELSRFEDVLWVEEGAMPLSTTNDGARAALNVNTINGAPYNLDGTGARVFVYDGGTVRSTHETFNNGGPSRVTLLDATAISAHSTHVAGTVAGDGAPSSASSRARGMAQGANILSAGYQQVGGTMLFWDNAGDIEADYTLARNTHNADMGTNSIGSNTASNNFACVREGDYGVSSNMLDGIVRGDNAMVGSPMILTWANGNERSGGTNTRGRCGSNYVTTAPPSCAKNPIHIAALNSDGSSMTSFSSWGPCDDGRLKPTVSGPGCETGRVSGEASIFSSVSTSDTSYGGNCGTSMSTPAVAGVVAMLIQDWRAEGHGGANDRPLPALVKTMLIHTTRDLGTDGPDFQYGYGLVDAKGVIDLLRAGTGTLGTGTTNWGTDSATNASVDNYTITVPAGTTELKASMAFDDAAAAAFAANAVVNDLDLVLIAPDNTTMHRPFVLSAGSPNSPATAGTNSVDNQEQVIVADPTPGDWTVRVTGTSVPTGPQTYGLAYSTESAPLNCTTTTYDYEADENGWTLTGATRVAAPAAGHGAMSLHFGNAISTTHEATLNVTLDPAVVKADLSFWWFMTTTENAGPPPAGFGFGWDFFSQEVRNAAGTPVLAVLDSRSDGYTASLWQQQKNLDLTPWSGQTVRLAFRGVNDSSMATRFWVDDVVLTTCVEGGGDQPPVVTITAPADNTTVGVGSTVNFAGTAIDDIDGDISASLTWTSSLDGAIGTGAAFSTSTLSVGTHTITASATDSNTQTGMDTITLTVATVVTTTFTSNGGQDGYITESSETSNVGGSVSNANSGNSGLRIGDTSVDRQIKSVVSFDTSALPDGAVITGATLRLLRGSLTGTNPFGTHGTCQADIHSALFSGNTALVAGDFQAGATSANVATMSNPPADGMWSEGTLNAAGLAAINKTGVTQLRVYLTTDDNDDNGNDWLGFYSGENATPANRPQLVITYQ